MVAKKSDIDQPLMKGLVKAVEILKRNMNTKVEPHVPFKGVLDKAVSDVFFHLMKIREHKLAGVVNEECTKANPCGACQNDVFWAHVAEAKKAGHIYVVSTSKWDVFYSQEEMESQHSRANREVANQIAEALQ